MKLYGLIGKRLSHSFSQKYFQNKFLTAGLKDHCYLNFELNKIREILLLKKQFPELKGLNVTIPYKTSVIDLLDSLTEEAREIKAVNTIIIREDKWIGDNTDWMGFRDSLPKTLKAKKQKVAILGYGGAARAIEFACKQMSFDYQIVSRRKGIGISYTRFHNLIEDYTILVNTTPLGMYPVIYQAPDIKYDKVSEQHFCYDLIYNPEKTLFLNRCGQQGAQMMNGYDMLIKQAEMSWRKWA